MIAPELAEMRRRRDERRREFADVTQRVARIQEELDLQLGGGQGQSEAHAAAVIVDVDGSDLTTTKLDELRAYLQHLQLEKVRPPYRELSKLIGPDRLLAGGVHACIHA
jgi:Ase1/PRC1/MAP65 family protein